MMIGPLALIGAGMLISLLVTTIEVLLYKSKGYVSIPNDDM